MGETSIEWTMGDDGTPGKTWNPTRGCSRVSEGCRNCYAERVAARFSGKGQPYEGLAVQRRGSKWTGEVRLVPERLADPLRWKKPRRVFVNSMSDLFHEKLSDEDIAAVFGVMAEAWRHSFQVLTKRPERMREWFEWADEYRSDGGPEALGDVAGEHLGDELCVNISNYIGGWSRWSEMPDDRNPLDGTVRRWPLPNVWLGVSVEDQVTADDRIPLLLETPAAVRFVSYEPAIGPVNLRHLDAERAGHPRLIVVDALTGRQTDMGRPCPDAPARLDWVIAGSESGPGARPAELDWFRAIRDQCAAAGVPFFFKQWVGGWVGVPGGAQPRETDGRREKVSLPLLDGRRHVEWPR